MNNVEEDNVEEDLCWIAEKETESFTFTICGSSLINGILFPPVAQPHSSAVKGVVRPFDVDESAIFNISLNSDSISKRAL